MIILGIDPGLRFAGFSVVQEQNNTTQIVSCGYLQMKSSQSIAERVTIFHDFFVEKIKKFNVTHIALETPFLGKNAQNFLKLGYLRGIVNLLSHQHGVVLLEFSPREIKQAVTGFGGAQKDQVARVLVQLFPYLKDHLTKEDVSDAVAIALSGLWRNNFMIK